MITYSKTQTLKNLNTQKPSAWQKVKKEAQKRKEGI
jgi:hypothetical protein